MSEFAADTKWLKIGTGLRADHGLNTTQCSDSLKETFRDAVVGVYHDPVVLSPLQDQSQSSLATRYEIDKATVSRMIKKQSYPRFDHFCIIAAAEDVHFERGVRAALAGYCAAYASVSQSFRDAGGHVERLSLEPDECLCLYFTIRSSLWERAKLTSDDELLSRAAISIEKDIRHYLPETMDWDTDRIDWVLTACMDCWCVLESVVVHDWFGI